MALSEDPKQSFAAALAWQGLGTAADVARRDLSRLEAAAPPAVRAQLARFRVAQRAALRGQPAAMAERDRIEAELAEALPGFAQRRRLLDATPEAACAALGGASLVDYVAWL